MRPKPFVLEMPQQVARPVETCAETATPERVRHGEDAAHDASEDECHPELAWTDPGAHASGNLEIAGAHSLQKPGNTEKKRSQAYSLQTLDGARPSGREDADSDTRDQERNRQPVRHPPRV